MGTYHTTMAFSFTSSDEFEVEVEIEYRILPGFAGDRTDPPEPATAEITEAFVVHDGKKVATPAWLFNRLGDDEALLAELLTHACEEDEAARDDMADALRKEQMLERNY